MKNINTIPDINQGWWVWGLLLVGSTWKHQILIHFISLSESQVNYKTSIYVVRKAEWGRNNNRWTAVLADNIVPDKIVKFAQVMCTSCYAKFHWRSGAVVGGPPGSMTAHQKLTKNWKWMVYLINFSPSLIEI